MLRTALIQNKLYIYGQEDFSLERSCFCGQTFRWQNNDGVLSCVIGDELVYAEKKDGVLVIYPCNEKNAEKYIKYFDLERDYKKIEERMENDITLKRCIPYASGIRIFSQEPFETLISFIVSANNNIKRIAGIIDKMCRTCGTEKIAYDGTEYYTFPTAEVLAAMPVEKLHELGLGYRDEYIKRTAAAVAEGFSLDELRNMPYEEAKKRLCTLRGVGGKVADCVLLFSLGHGEAFPMDVWMKRAVAAMFFDGNTPTKSEQAELIKSFGADAGRIQQYIFHYARETGLKSVNEQEAHKGAV